jgi:hypothetical protein
LIAPEASVAAASQGAVAGVMAVGMVGSMGGMSSAGSMFSLANAIQLIMILFCLRIAIDEGVVAYMAGMSFSAMDFSFLDDYNIPLPGWSEMNVLAIPETQELTIPQAYPGLTDIMGYEDGNFWNNEYAFI